MWCFNEVDLWQFMTHLSSGFWSHRVTMNCTSGADEIWGSGRCAAGQDLDMMPKDRHRRKLSGLWTPSIVSQLSFSWNLHFHVSLTDICCQVSPLNNLRFGLRFRTDKAWSPYFISWRPCHRIPLGFGLMQNLDLKCSPTRIDILIITSTINKLQSVQLNWINQFMLVRFGGNLVDLKFEQSLEPIMTTKLSFSIIMNNLGHGLCHRINTESNLSLSFDWIWLSWTEPGVMTFCHHRVCKLDRQMALQ